MTLDDLAEVKRLDTPHPEFTADQVSAAKMWIADGSEVSNVEQDRYTIIKRENSYALRRNSNQDIVGWVLFRSKAVVGDRDVWPLLNIHVLPKYRHTRAILILINALRSLLDAPVYVDDAIFTGGMSMLRFLLKGYMPINVSIYNKKSGTLSPATTKDLEQYQPNTALMFEYFDAAIEHTFALPGSVGIAMQLEHFSDINRVVDSL